MSWVTGVSLSSPMEFLILWEDRLLPQNIYFVGFFSALYLWHINMQYSLMNQVRYISQDIQEIKYCNILLCWRQLVPRGRCDDLGDLSKKSLQVMDFANFCDMESLLHQEADPCVISTSHPLTRTSQCS